MNAYRENKEKLYFYLKDKKRNSKGFSLIEILVVLAIITVLGLVGIPKYTAYVQKGKQDSARPALHYIHNVFNLNYIQKRHFGGVNLEDVKAPKGYCIQVSIPPNIEELKPKGGLIGTCHHKRTCTSCKVQSGFVAIACGETEELDVAINHHGEVLIAGKDKYIKCSSKLENGKSIAESDACTTHKKSSECQQAGCRYMSDGDGDGKCEQYGLQSTTDSPEESDS